MEKDFIMVPSDSGQNNGSFDVVVGENAGAERSNILIVSGGGINKTIDVIQKKGGSDDFFCFIGLFLDSAGNTIAHRSFGIQHQKAVVQQSGSLLYNIAFAAPPQTTQPLVGTAGGKTFMRFDLEQKLDIDALNDAIVVGFTETNNNMLYAVKNALTIKAYRSLGKYRIDLDYNQNITIDDTEVKNINEVLYNKSSFGIRLRKSNDVIRINVRNVIWNGRYITE